MVDHDKQQPGCFTETSTTVHKSRTDKEPVERTPIPLKLNL